MRFRYSIDCPISVLSPGRGRKRTIARGWLHDIGESGARIFLNEPLPVEGRFTLDVHLPNPDSKITTIRFQARVTGVRYGPPYEMALSFLGKGGFIRGKVAEFQEGCSLVRPIESYRWIH
ncbi:MAG TPA: PilZ domain-containing protein [Terriglobia bacterium]|nr:PilZ domain-containing protein [Terriglobia bacterium]